MGKDNGLFHIIDEASRQLQDVQYIFGKIKERIQGIHVKQISSHEFTIAHYTGKIVYDASEISEKNRDFVPPEMIETLRQSSLETVKDMFTNKLTKAGNLTIVVDDPKTEEKKTPKSKWGVIMQETTKLRVRKSKLKISIRKSIVNETLPFCPFYSSLEIQHCFEGTIFANSQDENLRGDVSIHQSRNFEEPSGGRRKRRYTLRQMHSCRSRGYTTRLLSRRSQATDQSTGRIGHRQGQTTRLPIQNNLSGIPSKVLPSFYPFFYIQ